jgi:hypothetical protein
MTSAFIIKATPMSDYGKITPCTRTITNAASRDQVEMSAPTL